MSAAALRDALITTLNEQKMARLQSIIDQATATGPEADQRRQRFSYEAACLDWLVKDLVPAAYVKVVGDTPVEGTNDSKPQDPAAY